MPSSVQVSAPMEIEEIWASWYDGQDANPNLAQVKASCLDGYCYLKLLCYFPEFGRVNPFDFALLLTRMKRNLGPDPLARDALTEVCIAYFGLQKMGFIDQRSEDEITDSEVDEMVAGFTMVYDKAKLSPIKMDVLFNNKRVHLAGEPNISCSCESLICKHGYSLKALASVCIMEGVTIGASGFNMDEFLNGGLDNDQEEMFDEIYSSLTVKPPGDRTKNWVSQEQTIPKQAKLADQGTLDARSYMRSQGFAPQPNDGRPLNVRQMQTKVQEVVKADSESNRVIEELQDQMRALTETVARSTLSIQESLMPNDSSSVAERYTQNRRFMRPGTVIGASPVLNHHGATTGSTVLTVEDDMISGFVQDDVSRERERHFVSKLKPVNGLPRPFANNRLNFLINFSTGLQRCLEVYPDEMLRCLYKSMNSDSAVPVDNLLRQVLCITIDRHEGLVVANPFRLPYIEIGMLVSQAAITAMIDLTMAEFRQCWFQEFKGLRIPDFWNVYSGVSQDPVQQLSRRRTEPRAREAKPSHQKSTRTKTLLGF